MPEARECPFCKVDKERNRVLFEGKRVFAVLSNPRLMEGHVLVIPKVHVGGVFELAPVSRHELFATVLDFQERMIQIFSERWRMPAGCDVSWHTRPFMPTTNLTIPGHAHVHLRPRFFKDPFYEQVSRHETEVFQDMSDEERDHYQKLLSI